MTELNCTVEQIRVGDADLVVERAGQGPSVLLLHEELGCPGTTEWQVELAKNHTLIQVHHPGFSRTESVQWISSMRDLACFYAWFLREQKLSIEDIYESYDLIAGSKMNNESLIPNFGTTIGLS